MEHSKTSDRLNLLEEANEQSIPTKFNLELDHFSAFRVASIKDVGSSSEEKFTLEPGLRINVRIIYQIMFKFFGSKLSIILEPVMTQILVNSQHGKMESINFMYKQDPMVRIMLESILLSMQNVCLGHIEMKIKNTILFLCHLSLGLFTLTWPSSKVILTKFDKDKKPIKVRTFRGRYCLGSI